MKVNDLVKLLEEAQEAYYNSDPIMLDAEFDELVDQLRDIEPENSFLKKVGVKPTSALQKVKHNIPMGSQAKIKTEDEFLKWVRSTGQNLFCVQEKLDGLSVELLYKNGKLVEAITRGDGFEGESILHTVKLMQNVEHQIKSFSGSLRGEIILQKSLFNEHFDKEKYSNPRNTAAGLSRRKDPDPNTKHLSIQYFDVISNDQKFETEAEKVVFIQNELSLRAVISKKFKIENIIKMYDYYKEGHRETLDYDIDGLVIKVNDLGASEALGEVDNRPKGQVAWKFPPQLRKTFLRAVTWQVGRAGRISPVGHFDPVDVGGAIIRKASLYNVSYIEKLGLGIGSTIQVSRANDVIPRVEKVLENPGTINIPEHCPLCSSIIIPDGEYLLCNNEGCPGKQKGNFIKWIKTLEIDECGEEFVNDIVDNGLVKDVSDLYCLTEEDLIKLPGYKTRKAQKILENIKKSKNLPLATFLAGLNIPSAGLATFEALVNSGYNSLEKVKVLQKEDLVKVDGVGDITADVLLEGIYKKQELIEKLLNNGVSLKEATLFDENNPIAGKSFCITGQLCIKRSDAQKRIKEKGGIIKSSVSKGLDYLVQANPSSTSGKSQKAIKCGTKIISEDDFLDLINFDVEDILKE